MRNEAGGLMSFGVPVQTYMSKFVFLVTYFASVLVALLH